MNTASSIFLAGLITLFLVVDAVFFGWQATLFLAMKFAGLLDWMAFWR